MAKDIHAEIDKLLNSTDNFAVISLNVKKHLGEVSNIDVMTMTTYKFFGEHNTRAATQFYSMMQTCAKSNYTGSLTSTMTFRDGKVQQMQVQDYKKI